MATSAAPSDDLDAVIARIIEACPPLTKRQKERLVAIFAGSRDK